MHSLSIHRPLSNVANMGMRMERNVITQSLTNHHVMSHLAVLWFSHSSYESDLHM